MRAARLEEENARLRKELEEARHPKPVEEPKPEAPPRAVGSSARGPLIIGVAVVFTFIVILLTTGVLTKAPIGAPVQQAKTLAPSPSIEDPPANRPPPDWNEESHFTEIDIRAVTHGVKPQVHYAVGAGGTILRKYGDAWKWTLETSGTTNDLHGVAEQLGKVCAVGDNGVATCALDPAKPTWKLEKTGTTADLLALTEHYGFLAVGRHGVIMHRTDDGWQREESGTKEDLFGVSGDYVVGAHGTILAVADNRWRKVESPTTADLYAVESHLHEVVVVGAGGVILQLGDPRAGFQLVKSGVTTDLYAVAHGSAFDSYAAGAGGVVLSTSGGSAPWVRQNIDTTRDLHTIDAWLPMMFIAGDHGTVLSRKY